MSAIPCPQAAGIRADAGHHNALLQALWGGGGLQTQACAVAHLDVALNGGSLRCIFASAELLCIRAPIRPGGQAARPLYVSDFRRAGSLARRFPLLWV